MSIVVKRVYDQLAPDDGYRVLVDRLWPRGLSRDAAHLDLWVRDVAPTTKLRTWYDHKVTLLFAARDRDHNEARVLAAALRRRPAHSHR